MGFDDEICSYKLEIGSNMEAAMAGRAKGNIFIDSCVVMGPRDGYEKPTANFQVHLLPLITLLFFTL